MPIYEYVCEKCGKLNEVLQKVNDPAPEKCDACDSTAKLTRIVSRTSFQLKGGGWYSDLYSSTKKGGDSKGSSASSTTTTASSSSTSSSSSSSASSSTATSSTPSK